VDALAKRRMEKVRLRLRSLRGADRIRQTVRLRLPSLARTVESGGELLQSSSPPLLCELRGQEAEEAKPLLEELRQLVEAGRKK